jgi:hypothetical protein
MDYPCQSLSLIYLVDTYYDTGIFMLILGPHFIQVTGIKLFLDLICFAIHNVALKVLCIKCYNASRRALESQRTKGTAEEEIRLY